MSTRSAALVAVIAVALAVISIHFGWFTPPCCRWLG
jgi:hypothetical protein